MRVSLQGQRPIRDAGWHRPSKKHAATTAALRAASEAQLAASDARIAISTDAAPTSKELSSRPRERRQIPASYSASIAQTASRRRKDRYGEQLPPEWSMSSARNLKMVDLSASPGGRSARTSARRNSPQARADVSRRYYVAEVVVPWADITKKVEAEFDAAQKIACRAADTDAAQRSGAAIVPEAGIDLMALQEAEAAADALLVADGQLTQPAPCPSSLDMSPEPGRAARLPARPPRARPPMDVVRAPDPAEGSTLETPRARAAEPDPGAMVADETGAGVAPSVTSMCSSLGHGASLSEVETLKAHVAKSEQTIAVLRAQVRVRDRTIAQLEERLATTSTACLPSPSGLQNTTARDDVTALRATVERLHEDAKRFGKLVPADLQPELWARKRVDLENGSTLDGPSPACASRGDVPTVPQSPTKEESATLLNRLAAIKARWVPSPGLEPVGHVEL